MIRVEPEVEPTWHLIPEFNNYEISKILGVRSRFTKQILKVYVTVTQYGPTTYVEMHDKDGYRKQVSLDHLYETLFKE